MCPAALWVLRIQQRAEQIEISDGLKHGKGRPGLGGLPGDPKLVRAWPGVHRLNETSDAWLKDITVPAE